MRHLHKELALDSSFRIPFSVSDNHYQARLSLAETEFRIQRLVSPFGLMVSAIH